MFLTEFLCCIVVGGAFLIYRAAHLFRKFSAFGEQSRKRKGKINNEL